jgi:hypothetical protein
VSKNVNKKKSRRQRRSPAFPWPLVALGGVLLAAAVFLFANKAGGADGGGSPVVTVDQPSIDYGHVKFGEDRQFKIKVTNAGEGLLRFKEKPYVEVLEGC